MALGREVIKTVPGVGYRLILEATPEPEPMPGPALPTIPSLAVLPFTNLTGRADKDCLVDGIAHEITSELGRVSAFFVISSTSTATLKGRVVDLLAAVGRKVVTRRSRMAAARFARPGFARPGFAGSVSVTVLVPRMAMARVLFRCPRNVPQPVRDAQNRHPLLRDVLGTIRNDAKGKTGRYVAPRRICFRGMTFYINFRNY